MIREKTALRYAKELREFLNELDNVCEKRCTGIFCSDCSWYKKHEYTFNARRTGKACLLTAVIKDMEGEK